MDLFRFNDLTPAQQQQVDQHRLRWQYANEREWHQYVRETARQLGWRVFDWHDSRRTTPGWPDLALVRPPRFMLAELKTDEGRLTARQQEVIADLQASGIEVHIWRPVDEQLMRTQLRARHTLRDAGP